MDPDNAPPTPQATRPATTRGGTVEPVTPPRTRAQPAFASRDTQGLDTRDLHAAVHERTGPSAQSAGRADGPQGPRVDAALGPKVVPLPVPGRAQPTADRADAGPVASEQSRADPRPARPDATTERAAHVARLETALMDRYLIKRAPVHVGNLTVGHTEYRFRGDTARVAFTESTFRLATDTNSPSVARSMVDVAEARGWKALRVSGNDDFKRMVWLEASVRGVKALGYEPNLGDLDALKRQREARLVNRIEPAAGDKDSAGTGARADGKAGTTAPAKGFARGSGGRKAVLAAIEAVLVAQGIPDKRREAVMAAATEQLAQRQRAAQAPTVKVFDKTAPSQGSAQREANRPAPAQTADAQRLRERNMPVPTR